MSKPLALIIEDDTDISQIFAKTLEGDFETEVYYDGASARQRLDEVQPIIIILDLNLPEMSGRELLAHIRATPSLEKTRVLLCTADASQAQILDEQADIVLLKPVSPSQLRELARRFL